MYTGREMQEKNNKIINFSINNKHALALLRDIWFENDCQSQKIWTGYYMRLEKGIFVLRERSEVNLHDT